MTDFEKYLKANKSKMMVSQVNPRIWVEIENGMLKHKQTAKFRYIKLASVAAILLLGVLLYPTVFQQTKMEIPQELLHQYGFNQQDITGLLDQKLVAIKTTAIPITYKNDLQLLLDQVNYLDRTYAASITYLKEKPYEEDIAKEVLNYYKIKRDLLEKIIFEMEKINHNEQESDVQEKRVWLSL